MTQTSLNGSARRESYSAHGNYWATKNTDRYPSQALSDCCEYSTLGKQLGTERSRQVKLEAFHHVSHNVRADDVGCSRETDHE
jgi:hypothetical protein